MHFKTVSLFLITFVVAACSIIYELLLANTLSLMAGNTIFWYSLTIGTFLAGLGLGSFAKTRIFPKDDLIGKFFKVEIILSVLGASIASAIFFAHSLSVFLIFHGWGQWSLAVFFAIGLLMILAIGFFSGIELPLLMEIGNSFVGGAKRISNRVLGADYFGSLAGAVLFPLFLLPHFSNHEIGFIVAVANLVMALAILRSFRKKSKFSSLQTAMVAVLFLVLLTGLATSERSEQYFAKKYYYYLEAGKNVPALFSAMSSFPEIERIHSHYQQIDIVEPTEFSPSEILAGAYFENEEGREIIDERALYLNGDWQFSTYTEKIYHEYFAHVPIGISQNIPQKILVLGGGDGLLARELLKYSQVRQIVLVEIDGRMIDLAKSHPIIKAANREALFDKRVDVRVGDGYDFVRGTEEKFDAIFIDFPTPADYNTSKIYSREFYFFVAKILKKDGFVALDAPGIGSFMEFTEKGDIIANEEKTSWFQYYHTLKAAGFQTVAPFLSMLEIGNPKAWQIADELVKEQRAKEGRQDSPVKIDPRLVEEADRKEVERLMKKLVLNMQEGFIFAKKEEIHALVLAQHDVNTIVNPRRVQLAFFVPFAKDDRIDWSRVNSIMKPTLPNSSVWRIRLPYGLN